MPAGGFIQPINPSGPNTISPGPITPIDPGASGGGSIPDPVLPSSQCHSTVTVSIAISIG